MKRWTAALLACAIGAILFILSLGYRFEFDWPAVLFLGALGGTVGSLALPELYRRRPSWASAWQLGSGAVGGMLVAASLSFSLESLLAGLLFGIILGHLAPLWLRHLPLP